MINIDEKFFTDEETSQKVFYFFSEMVYAARGGCPADWAAKHFFPVAKWLGFPYENEEEIKMVYAGVMLIAKIVELQLQHENQPPPEKEKQAS